MSEEFDRTPKIDTGTCSQLCIVTMVRHMLTVCDSGGHSLNGNYLAQMAGTAESCLGIERH